MTARAKDDEKAGGSVAFAGWRRIWGEDGEETQLELRLMGKRLRMRRCELTQRAETTIRLAVKRRGRDSSGGAIIG